MSHGRIFIISDRDTITGGNYTCPFDDVDMCGWISGCDYVVPQNKEKFLEDIKWFSEVYDVEVKVTSIQERTVGILDQINVYRLNASLLESKTRRLEKIQAELDKDYRKISMWDIAHYAYNESGFYFGATDGGFYKEMAFLEDYMVFDLHPKELIIAESFDYHV